MSQVLHAPAPETPLLADLPATCRAAAESAGRMVAAGRQALAERLTHGGRLSNAALEAEQYAAHGLAWIATYAEACASSRPGPRRSTAAGRLGETERLILRIGFGEYLGQIAGGIPMSQVEIVRPADSASSRTSSPPSARPEVDGAGRRRQHRRRPRPPRRADACRQGAATLRRHRPRRRRSR